MDFISLSIDGERERADQAFGLEEGIAREGDSGQRRGEKNSLGNRNVWVGFGKGEGEFLIILLK